MDFRKQQLLFFFLIVFGNLVAGRVLDSKSEDSETSNVDAENGHVSELVSNETLSRDKIETTEIQLRYEKSTQTNSNVGTSNSPFCQDSRSMTSSTGNVSAAGCVMESLIPRDKTYLVEFQDSDRSGEDPSICWRTCSLIYPNTTLALVSRSNQTETEKRGKLTCHCALSDAIDETTIGPSVFCNSVCKNGVNGDLPCGGRHTFKDNGITEVFFSIFCIFGGPVPPTPPPPTPPPNITTTATTTASSTSTTSSSTTTPGDNSEIETLHNILESLVDSNVMSIVIIGLIVCLLILVLVLITWIYLFVESLDPSASSAFYRRFSTKRPNNNNPVVGNQSANILSHHEGYGTTNRAFDPTPETDPVEPFQQTPLSDLNKGIVPADEPKYSGNMLSKRMSSDEDDDEDEGLDDDDDGDGGEFVKREGRSKFYDPDSLSQASAETQASEFPTGQHKNGELPKTEVGKQS